MTNCLGAWSCYPGDSRTLSLMRSGRPGIEFFRDTLSSRYCQKPIPSLRQVFFKLVKVSRQRRPQITASRSADLALLHVFPDVCLTCIVVQRHVRSFQHHQKLRLVLVDPLQGQIQGLIARVCGEYFIKTLLKLCFLFRARTLLVGFST